MGGSVSDAVLSLKLNEEKAVLLSLLNLLPRTIIPTDFRISIKNMPCDDYWR